MSEIDQRAALERLIQGQQEDYSSLSRMLGRNVAYIQQFIRRGTPKRLAERDRRILANYFGVDESELGGPPSNIGSDGSRLVPVPRLDVGASAGPGAFNGGERAMAHVGFEEKWLRGLAHGKPSDLSLIKVRGDSMSPTLSDGDDILVDTGDALDRLRDGIYVLRREDALLVKRVAPSPVSHRITVRSDNDSYPSWPDVEIGDVDIIGRVVWTGRRIG